MRLGTRVRYGTRALVDIALHGHGSPVSAREIAERQGISVKYLEILLTTLNKAGILRTLRGAGGGHALALPAEALTLRQVYEALEGVEGLVGCSTKPDACVRSGRCVTRDIWCELSASLSTVLEETTIADLVARSRGLAVTDRVGHEVDAERIGEQRDDR